MIEIKEPFPRVSIGLPVYNGESFLEEAIRSLLAQTFQDFELIISDNGSTDKTESICRDYIAKDMRLRYFRHTTNRGALANFEFVLQHAQGSFFMWASDDDFYTPNWLEALITRGVQDNTAAFGVVQYVNVDRTLLCSNANRIRFNYRAEEISRRIKFYFTPHHSGKMILFFSLYPRQVLKSAWYEYMTQRYTNEKYNSDDLFLVFLLLSRLRFVSVDGAVMFKRAHPASDSYSLGNKSMEKRSAVRRTIIKLIEIFVPRFQNMRYFRMLSRREIILALTFLPLGIIYHAFFALSCILRKKRCDLRSG